MRRVSYAGGAFVTADEVAAAVIEFAEELANRELAAHIEVPAMDLPGGASTVEVLVGPSSQLLSEPVEDDRALDGAAFVADIAARIQELRAPSKPEWDDSFDWGL